MGDEKPATDGKKPEGDASLIQTAFPQQPTVVFFVAIVAGLLLIVMTTGFHSYFAVNGMQSNLVLCMGAALVLAAFGGQATVRIGRIIMVGAAGVTLGLFIYLQQSSRDLFLQGRIDQFDFDAYQSLDISLKNQILGRIVQNNNYLKRSYYDFVIFKQDVDSPVIEVTLTKRAPTANQAKERLLRVPVDDIETFFGERQRLIWELREEGHGPDSILTLFDLSNKKTVAREEVTVGTSPIARTLTGPRLSGSAFAQEGSDINLPMMLERLNAEDTSTRRGARDALSQAPLDFIPVMMQTFRAKFSNYQVKLGICVALAQMLRADKTQATAISAKLTEDDLNRLLDAAGDPDRTVRVYAGEFLFDLGDTRTTKLAIPRAAGTSDDNARYDWLFVSQDGWRKLSVAEKAALADPLNKAKQKSGQQKKSGRSTLQLFDKLQMDEIQGVGADLLLLQFKEGKAVGIDVSHHDEVKWDDLKSAGVSFAFIRATEGNSLVDPKFNENWQQAKRVEIIRGAYHVLRGGDAEDQAENFAGHLHLEAGDLPPVADFEPNPIQPSPTIDELKLFLKLIEQKTNCTPIIFSTGTYMKELADRADQIGKYPLWLGHYGPTPTVPSPWTSWTFWQFTDRLSVKDLPRLDFNGFNGTDSELRDFAKLSCTRSHS